jgi:hypothetical protein
MTILESEYFSDYTFKNPRLMLDKVKRYGINFRSSLNFTPLMCATYMLNEGHIDELLKSGASLLDVDGYCRTAFHILLSRLYNNQKKMPTVKVFNFYNKLCPPDISVQTNEKLIKIGANKIEFLILNLLLGVLHEVRGMGKPRMAFTSEVVLARLQVFSGSNVIIESRLNRAYVSSVLSRNEINSNYKYSRKLFKRVSQGKYVLNPGLQIKTNELWVSLADFLSDVVIA